MMYGEKMNIITGISWLEEQPEISAEDGRVLVCAPVSLGQSLIE